ncbi:MAG: hypothetical protein ABI182_01330 [Candidatus Baltobacteraceae bacterium]
MRSAWLGRSAFIAILGFSLSACGGGSSGGANSNILPAGPGAAQGSAAIVVSGTIDGSGPYLLANKRRPEALRGRFPRALLSLKNVTVTGTLFPGDAGVEPVRNTVTIPTPGTVYAATVSFSNVPVHNNQWVILEFVGNATDGSQIALGELAGLVNVTSSPTNSAALTKTTTQTFQAFTELLAQGDLSTFDLDNTPALATTLTTDVAATHVAVDPTTQLFSVGGLTSIVNSLEPLFERDLTISSSPTLGGTLTLMRDWTNAGEVNLANEETAFSGLFSFLAALQNAPTVSFAWGSNGNCPLGSGNPPNVPPVVTVKPFEASACLFANPTGSMTIRNVYGGHIILDVTNNVSGAGAPFDGGHLSVAGEAPGTHPVTVPDTLTSSTFTVSDPAAFAFGPAFWGGSFGNAQLGGFFTTQPNFGTTLQSDTFFTLFSRNFSTLAARVIPKSPPYGATTPHNQIVVDTFNPWAIPSADMALCGGISCFALSSTGTLTVTRPFADGGNDLAFFNWKAGGKATHIATASGGGYSITFSGPGGATLTSTTPTALEANQHLTVTMDFTMPNDQVTISASDAANSNVYSGTGTLSFGSANLTMNTSRTVKIKQVVITISYTGGAGTHTLTNITAPQF